MIFYDDIIDLLHSEPFSDLIPDGLSLSQPILSLKNNNIIDNFFVSTKSNGILKPIYKFGIIYDLKEIDYIEKYEDIVYEKVLTCDYGLTYDEFIDYKKAYSSVRQMYSGSINIDKAVIIEYSSLLLKLVPDYLLDFYNNLSNEFFEFLNNALSDI